MSVKLKVGKMWLDDLKIAITANDITKIEHLCDKIPNDLSINDAICAQNLLSQAKLYCSQQMDDISAELEKLRKIRKFNEN